MAGSSFNWLSEKAETRGSGIDGYGTFAKCRIEKGEIIAVFGGKVIRLEDWRKLPGALRRRSLAISSNLELIPPDVEWIGDGDYINHSCDPNTGIRGQIFLVSIREIETDEEVTFDYAMVIGDPNFRMVCRCSRRNCRKVVRGDDWKDPVLQRRYHGYFSMYIQEMIDGQKR
jgi:SET domain-containing protein